MRANIDKIWETKGAIHDLPPGSSLSTEEASLGEAARSELVLPRWVRWKRSGSLPKDLRDAILNMTMVTISRGIRVEAGFEGE